MLISINQVALNTNICGTDGDIGGLHDAYFNGVTWRLRYFVVDSGSWLPGKKHLLSPHALEQIKWPDSLACVSATKKQFEQSPGVLLDRPISRKMEAAVANHFAWSAYWSAGMGAAVIHAEQASDTSGVTEDELLEHAEDLRSVNEVVGYDISAVDGEVGKVEDFLIDDETWTIRFMVVKTGSFFSGNRILLAPEWVRSVRCSERAVNVSLSCETIKNGPVFDPTAAINHEVEERIFDAYGRVQERRPVEVLDAKPMVRPSL
jgi:hypothetical protein